MPASKINLDPYGTHGGSPGPYTPALVGTPARLARRVAAVAALAVAALTTAACESPEATPPTTAGPPATTAAGTGPTPDSPSAAVAKTRVGAAAGGCRLPVSFGIAEDWKPKAVEVTGDDPLAELTRRGPLTMACEIDAKPAGSIGFLRVWTGKGEPRAALTALIGADAREPAFREVPIGGRPGLEVVYQQKDKLDDTIDPERAFAVPTGTGVAAVALDSLDGEEHADMLPAYELAKASLTVTG